MHHLVEKFKAKNWSVYTSVISGTLLKEYCLWKKKFLASRNANSPRQHTSKHGNLHFFHLLK